jgi:hypothetical protein
MLKLLEFERINDITYEARNHSSPLFILLNPSYSLSVASATGVT